jgi:hypothetical protein
VNATKQYGRLLAKYNRAAELEQVKVQKAALEAREGEAAPLHRRPH